LKAVFPNKTVPRFSQNIQNIEDPFFKLFLKESLENTSVRVEISLLLFVFFDFTKMISLTVKSLL